MDNKKFYYTCSEDSKLGKALQALLDQCNDAERAANDWAEKHHATAYVSSGMYMAGGVTFVSFNHTPDSSLWKVVEDVGEGDLYEPNVPEDFDLREVKERQKNGKPLLNAEKLELERLALPTIDGATLLGLLNAQTQKTRKLPGFFTYNGKWWIVASYILCAEGLECTTGAAVEAVIKNIKEHGGR